MNRTIANVAATALWLAATAAIAADDLEPTMKVIDDLSELDGDLVLPEGPAGDAYEEDLFDLDQDGIPDDQEDESGLFNQYTELDDSSFEIETEGDGFEHENEETLAEEEFESEDEFEAGEDVDTDEFDEIEEPADDMEEAVVELGS